MRWHTDSCQTIPLSIRQNGEGLGVGPLPSTIHNTLHGGCRRSDTHFDGGLDGVSDLQVVEAIDGDAALEAGSDLTHVILAAT